MESRTRSGTIVTFDPVSWWGKVRYDGEIEIEFNATCYVGCSTRYLPKVGDAVCVLFSDATAKRLHSVISVPV
jgi:hypothetical protein